MKKPIIAIDIDDVLAQGTESLRLLVNERLGVNLQPEHYAIPGEYWGYYEQVWKIHGLDGKITMADLDPQMIEDQSHVPVFDQAKEVLQDLSKKYLLIVVTARNPAWEPATKRWLDERFPDIFGGIYFAGHKAGGQTKGELCHAHGAKWLIDDNVIHAQTALEQGIQVVLFGDYGWHKNASISKDIVRCKNWSAVAEHFNGVS